MRWLSPIQVKTWKPKCGMETVPGLLPSACSQGSEEKRVQLQMPAFIINRGTDPRLPETY